MSISKNNLTPWLADACLEHLMRRTPSSSSLPKPKPKLVQILNRGGSFWTSRNAQDVAWLLVTDGLHTLVANLSQGLRQTLLHEASESSGAIPFLNHARHCVGLLQGYQWDVEPGSSPASPPQVALNVPHWQAKPELMGMIVKTSLSNVVQPLSEHIPVRRALLLQQNQEDVPPVQLGNAQEAMENPQLMEELLQMAAQDDNDDAEEEEEEEEDEDYDDEEELLHIKDMFETQPDQEEDVHKAASVMTSLSQRGAIRSHSHTQESPSQLTDDEDTAFSTQPQLPAVPPTLSNQQDDSPETDHQSSFAEPLTQPSVTTAVPVRHAPTSSRMQPKRGPNSSITLVEVATQTEFSTMTTQEDDLPCDVPGTFPTPTKQPMTSRDVTSVTSNTTSNAAKRRRRLGSNDWTSPKRPSSVQQRQWDEDSLSTSATARGSMASTVWRRGSGGTNQWDQLKKQLDDPDLAPNTMISWKVDPRLVHPLRTGDLARWLHKNIVGTSAASSGMMIRRSLYRVWFTIRPETIQRQCQLRLNDSRSFELR